MSSELSVECLEEILKNFENDLSLKVERIDVGPACPQGRNFMAVVSGVVIYEYENRVVVKQPVKAAKMIELFSSDVVFNAEVLAYNEIIPLLIKYIDYSIEVPLCLYANKDLIILEDLRRQGFSIPKVKTKLDLKQCKCALEELAKFHAASLIVKRKDLTSFTTAIQNLPNIYCGQPDSPISKCISYTLDSILNLLKHDQTEEVKNAIQKLENLKPLGVALSKTVLSKCEFEVINHGDFSNNNLLTKIENDEVKIKIVDLQALQYSSPALDLSYFLCMNEMNSDENLDILLDHYVSHIVKFSASGGVDLKEKFTKEWIKMEFERFKTFGFMIQLLFQPLFLDSYNFEEICMEATSFDNFDHMEPLLKLDEYKQKVLKCVLDFTS